ncbi:MAG: hypothetical protein R3Y19_01535 [Rikenellaceae bacterium]
MKRACLCRYISLGGVFLPLVLLALGVTLGGCGSFSLYNPDRGEVIARVGDSTLYADDLKFGQMGISMQDSVAHSRLYIQQWVSDQIELQQATLSLGDYQEVIEAKVREYRKSLLRYHFQQGYISENLDTLVTSEQVAQYYSLHRSNFRLAGPLVKVRVARIPSQLRQSNTLRELFQSSSENDINDFRELCEKNNYRLNDLSDSWTPFSQVLSMIPFSNTDFDGFLRSKKYYEVEDDQYQYMMAVVDKLYTGDLSPLEMVTTDIRHILLQDRRQALLNHFKDSIYQSAILSGRVVLPGETTALDTLQTNIISDSLPESSSDQATN